MNKGRGGGGKGGNRGKRRDNSFSGNNRGRRNWDQSGRNDEDGGSFRKFTGTNSMSPRGYKSDRHIYFDSRNHNNHNNWTHNKRTVEHHFQNYPNGQMENQKDNQEDNSHYFKPPAPSEQPVQNSETPLRFKTEKTDPASTETKHKTKSPKTSQHYSSGSESKREVAPKTKSAEVSNPVPKIKIKKELTDSIRPEQKEVNNRVPPASRPTAPPAPSESSSSDSSSSSSSEEEEPSMPQPIRGGDLKPKKEKKSEDDVVCLGKVNKIENLADSDDPSVCIVCNKTGHASDDCQMKCRKCSYSSYQCQMVCKNCGETYTGVGFKSAPKPPNPFIVFMQFMQFCMTQFSSMFTDFEFPATPCENSVQCPDPPPTVEVSRKDIENSKTNRKRTKSESKQKKRLRKNCQPNTDDESDSDSVAASSSKRRKKRAKSITRETETPPVAAQQQPQQQPFGQHFGQSYSANHPFAGSFNSLGFNPMLAFSQMMGYNPVAMNFTR